jgi:hypothetical protein
VDHRPSEYYQPWRLLYFSFANAGSCFFLMALRELEIELNFRDAFRGTLRVAALFKVSPHPSACPSSSPVVAASSPGPFTSSIFNSAEAIIK